jgi:hypothetical protein
MKFPRESSHIATGTSELASVSKDLLKQKMVKVTWTDELETNELFRYRNITNFIFEQPRSAHIQVDK